MVKPMNPITIDPWMNPKGPLFDDLFPGQIVAKSDIDITNVTLVKPSAGLDKTSKATLVGKHYYGRSVDIKYIRLNPDFIFEDWILVPFDKESMKPTDQGWLTMLKERYDVDFGKEDNQAFDPMKFQGEGIYPDVTIPIKAGYPFWVGEINFRCSPPESIATKFVENNTLGALVNTPITVDLPGAP